MNNHVHLTGSNATPLSHAEVLAVKNAFVKALSSNGVGANEIAKVRRDLGLAAEAGMDKTLLSAASSRLRASRYAPSSTSRPPPPSAPC